MVTASGSPPTHANPTTGSAPTQISPHPKLVAQLEAVSQRLQSAETARAQYQKQIHGLQHSNQVHNTQMHDLQKSLEDQHAKITSLNSKTIDMGMQVGMHTNSITFIETSIAGHASQLSSLSSSLDNTKLQLLQAETKSHDLHINLQEQLQLQASNLLAFTSMYAQFMHSIGGIIPHPPPSNEPSNQPTTTLLALTHQPHDPNNLNIPESEFLPDFFVDEFPATPRRPIHASPLETPSPSSRPHPAKRIRNLAGDSTGALPPVNKQNPRFGPATASTPAPIHSDKPHTPASLAPSNAPPLPLNLVNPATTALSPQQPSHPPNHSGVVHHTVVGAFGGHYDLSYPA
ncbi:hypothetical protein ACA910_013747 [Epithemia clementina (nom. ined.)]